MSKTCPTTGKKVIDILTSEGLIIPMTDLAKVPVEEKIDKIEKLYYEIMATIGYDMTDEELRETPRRVAKMFCTETFTGWDPNLFPKCTTFQNKSEVGHFQDEMVVIKNIKNTSFCAHHNAPYDFVIDVAYVIKDTMIGISKLNRIVDTLSNNMTSQETLGKAIARAIQLVTESDSVAVRIEGSHGCVRYRGARDRNSRTATLAAIGEFAQKDSKLRNEFNAAIGADRREII